MREKKITVGPVGMAILTVVTGLALAYKFFRIAEEIKEYIETGEKITIFELAKRLVFAL